MAYETKYYAGYAHLSILFIMHPIFFKNQFSSKRVTPSKIAAYTIYLTNQIALDLFIQEFTLINIGADSLGDAVIF